MVGRWATASSAGGFLREMAVRLRKKGFLSLFNGRLGVKKSTQQLPGSEGLGREAAGLCAGVSAVQHRGGGGQVPRSNTSPCGRLWNLFSGDWDLGLSSCPC